MEFIRDFKKIDKNDVFLAGGKGASLGEMTKAGILVPAGFVILSNAFEKFLEDTDLNVEIDTILDNVKHDQISTVENASEKIQALILQAKMPEDIEKEIQKSFKNLGAKYVAIRSSATAEDSASAAWAGQLESYLNTTEKNLLENVKRCWASLFTPRAIFYRFEKDLHKQKISVAVVVQKMVESEKSGIAFSVHPVTQDRNQLIIEAGFGLGEAVVSGQITPDSYVVEKQPRRIIDKNIQTQSRGLYRVEKGGNEWRDISKERVEKQVLSDKEILELSELVLKIEDHYNFPVDIEWAYEHKNFYITQSRPITTLDRVEIKFSNLADKFIFLSQGQEFSPPIQNLSIFTQTLGWNTEKYYRYYTDGIPFHLLIAVNKDEQVLFMQLSKAKQLSRDIFKDYWRGGQDFSKMTEEHESNKKNIDALYKKITYNFIQSQDEKHLTGYVSRARDLFCESVAITLFARDFDKEMCSQLLREVDSEISEARLDELWNKTMIPINRSFEVRRLFYLAAELNKNKSLDKISESCQFFEANYNRVLTLQESQKYLMEKFNSLIDGSREELDVFEKQEKDNIATYTRVYASLSSEEKKLFDFIQGIIRLRDERKDSLSKSLLIIFRIAQKFFNDVGIAENFIYFYRVDELIFGIKYLKEHAEELKKRLSGYCVLVNYNGFLEEEYGLFNETADKLKKFYFEQQKNTKENEIIGQVGSPGKAKGTVVVVRNINTDGERFKKGNILVAGMTRPEFVPLMKKAAAIVTEVGGLTCHA
ncbi:MAG: PEP/pyruvate-binding domain-containing protein, partial [Patescibacteria group bacterium]